MLQGTDDRTDTQHRLDCLECWRAAVNPSANCDSVDTAHVGKRFGVGSLWLNTATNRAWHCFDSTPGSAVWS